MHLVNTKKEFTLEQIKERWLSKKWDEKDTFNIYIHSPFCPSICQFCIHAGSTTTINSVPYKKYYYEYLPNLIKSFSEVMESRVADTIYFGGGTASLMTEEVMNLIFESIPNFKDIPNKVFEGHPVTMNKKKINILAKYNFSYMTFGVQTFNDEILKQQNRIPAKVEVFKETIQYAKEKGIPVSCDLLAFIGDHTENAVSQLEEDLYFLANEVKPNVITIYPKKQAFESESTKGENSKLPLYFYEKTKIEENAYKISLKLRKAIFKFTKEHPEFKIVKNKFSFDKEEIIKSYSTNYFLTNLDENKFNEIHKYDSTSFGKKQVVRQNVLGLGSYGPVRPPYSYINDDFCYINTNENWEPKFIVTYDSNENKKEESK